MVSEDKHTLATGEVGWVELCEQLANCVSWCCYSHPIRVRLTFLIQSASRLRELHASDTKSYNKQLLFLFLTIFAYFPPHTFTSRIGFRNSVYIKEKPEILVTIYQEYTSGGKKTVDYRSTDIKGQRH